MWREKGITAGVYRNQQQWLISASSDGTTWLTISDKNLWASVVYNEGDTMSAINSWLYYQRWNNYWFGWGTVTMNYNQIDTSSYSRQNPYSSSEFRYWISPSRPDWSNPSNPELRWDVTNTNASRKWPCAIGYHVPNLQEYRALINIAETLWVTFRTIFKFPLSWWRWDDPYQPHRQNERWACWLSTTGSYVDEAWFLYLFPNGLAELSAYWWKCAWNTIRPFKNEPVTPDDTRTVLYQL